MPVFPLVGSTITERPGRINPSRSAASIIATPIRSLTEPPGFRYSSFAKTSASIASVSRCSATSGVLPTVCDASRATRTCAWVAPDRSSTTGITVSAPAAKKGLRGTADCGKMGEAGMSESKGAGRVERGVVVATVALVAVGIAAFSTAAARTAGGAKAAVTCFGKVATITGTQQGEVIKGTSGRDVIASLGGHDTVLSRQGNDFVCAGAGNDTVHAAEGFNRIFGGDGDDYMDGRRGPGNIVI